MDCALSSSLSGYLKASGESLALKSANKPPCLLSVGHPFKTVGSLSPSASVWRRLGASVIGSGHISRGVECQDAHGVAELPDGTLVIAVADGAGSARRSAEG